MDNSNPLQWGIGLFTTIVAGSSFEHRFIYWETNNYKYSFEWTNDSSVHIRISKNNKDIFKKRNDCTEKNYNARVPSRTVRTAIENCKKWLSKGNYDAQTHNCQDFVNFMRDCN